MSILLEGSNVDRPGHNHLNATLELLASLAEQAASMALETYEVEDWQESALVDDLRMIAVPDLTYITEIDGEPSAVAVALPNVNELIHDLGGSLFPLGLPKLLWRLKVVGPKTARLAILGIRKKHRNTRKYAGLSTYLYTKMNRVGRDLGIQWGELSWTLEDNGPVNVAIRLMGGKIYKKYRLYEKNT